MSEIIKPVIIIDLNNKTLQIHRSVFKLLGTPKYIQFYVNRDRTALGIMRCTQSEDQAVKIPKNNNEYYVLYGTNLERIFFNVCSQWEKDKPYMIKGMLTSDRTLVSFSLPEAEMINRIEVTADNENEFAETQNRS